MVDKEFGEWVRGLRESSGKSLRSLARDLGVSPTYWSMVERGTTPPPNAELLQRLVEVLRLPEYETYFRARRVPKEWLDLFFQDRDLALKVCKG